MMPANHQRKAIEKGNASRSKKMIKPRARCRGQETFNMEDGKVEKEWGRDQRS